MATTVLGLKTFAASDPVDYNEVNDNYVKIDNGVKTAMKGRAAHNLLDNSWFVNPVNQRGQSSYTGSKFGIDRWRTWNDSATITITSDGIKGDGTSASILYQNVENNKIPWDKTYTMAVGYSDGSVLCTSGVFTSEQGVGIWNSEAQAYLTNTDSKTTRLIRLWHATKTIAWAALYEGAYDASTLPAYVPKGYAAELAECKRYYERKYHNIIVKGQSAMYFSVDYADKRIDAPTITTITTEMYGNVNISTSARSTKRNCASGVIGTIPNAIDEAYWYGYIDISADL